jgi:aryl-alcohol dehydrogenase-like predicted oxidoreductase
MPWGSNPTRFAKDAFAPAADETPIAEQLDAFAEVIKAGKIRHLGLSNESAWGTMRFVTDSEARGTPRVQSIQNAYNLLNRTFETALAEVALHEDVGLLAYSPLAQGYLTGKYLDGARPAGARTTLFDRGQRYQTAGAEDAIKRYIALARDAGLDPAQMALAFVNSRSFVTANIIGATSMEQLRTDIASIDVKLSPEVEAQIDAIHQLAGNPCP